MNLWRWAAAACLCAALGCWREAPREVVLYTSCDDYLLREIIPGFEAESGIRVKLAGDTEATKTMGLVQRVIAERDRPRADVWWSNEPFGTMRLAEQGLLSSFTPAAVADFGGRWPEGLASAEGLWYGFGLRARVMVYNTARVKREDVPRRLAELTDAKWKGRVGIARPAFGTTRGHMGAMVAACGESAFRAWLTGLKANGVRLYDGNSAVVRAAAHGEIDVGLTDTDDVIVGQREGWPVAMAAEEGKSSIAEMCITGAVGIPNTVGIVKGARHPEEAAKLAEYLLSAKVERILAESESRNVPVREGLAKEMEGLVGGAAIPAPARPNLPMIYASIPAAMKACEEILGD